LQRGRGAGLTTAIAVLGERFSAAADRSRPGWKERATDPGAASVEALGIEPAGVILESPAVPPSYPRADCKAGARFRSNQETP